MSTSLLNFVYRVSPRLVDGVVSMSAARVVCRACWSRLQRSTRRGWTHVGLAYCTSVDVDRNALMRLLWICCNLFLELCSSWQDFDCHSTSRGPFAIVELLVSLHMPTSKLMLLICDLPAKAHGSQTHLFSDILLLPRCFRISLVVKKMLSIASI